MKKGYIKSEKSAKSALLNKKKCSGTILTMILVFFLITFIVTIGEFYRIHLLQQDVEYQLQRSVNCAVEFSMGDSYRQDKIINLDVNLAKREFYKYLSKDVGLDSSHRKYQDGKLDKASVPGKNIELSIDIDLQMYGEKLMRNKIGSVVAIEPQSGEILALVSSPNFNPSDLVGRQRGENFKRLNNDPLKPLLDRPLMARYPPGSTFKVVNSLIFQQEGIITPETRYPCHHGFIFGGLTVGCHGHPSPLDMRHSLQTSCNGYYCWGLKAMMDSKKYKNVQDAFETWKRDVVSFGFGYKTGVDFPNENRGFIPNAEFYNKRYGERGWKGLTIISIAIGQGEIIATPMQLANYASAIANQGYWITPHIVRKIEGEQIADSLTKKHVTNVDKKFFAASIDGMEMAVKGGTARVAQMDSITVCAKTGTAQNPHGKDHSIFMAFAPRENPKIAIAVVVENAGFGATWAGPIASLMMEKYLKGGISPARKALEDRMVNANLIPSTKTPR